MLGVPQEEPTEQTAQFWRRHEFGLELVEVKLVARLDAK
jgi:hypothetical protein